MADTLKSLVDASVQTEIDNLATSLRGILGLVNQLNSSPIGVKTDGSGSVNQRKFVEDLKTANDQLHASQQKVAESTSKVAEAQKLQAQTAQTSSTRMAAMTENSKLLHKALDDVKKQLQDGIAAGKLSAEQQAKLGEKTAILTTLVNQQQRGFASLTAEVRAGERALQTMREAGLQNTTAFKELQLSTATTRREFNNFAKEQKILSSEAPAVQALTMAARGLGGAYAAGAGAAALFGDENGKIAKEFEKLVAIMTLLKGITELNEAIQQKNAIATSVNVMWNKALTFVYGEEAVAAATAAEATGALYIAMTGGLVLVIGAVAAGVYTLSKGLYEWANADEILTEKETKLADASKELNEARNKEIDIIEKINKDRRFSLEAELKAAEKAGASSDKILAIKTKLNEFDKKAAAEMVARTGVTEKSLKSLEVEYFSAAATVTYYKNLLKGDEEDKKQKKFLDDDKEHLKSAQAKYDNLKVLYEQNHKAFYDNLKANQEGEEIEIEKSKLSAEERRKFELQVAKERVEATIQANETILSAEDSTQKQRLEATKIITDEQIKLIRAERDEKLKDPGLTPGAALAVKEAANAAIAKSDIAGKEKLKKINEDYAKRDLAAYYALRNAQLEAQKNTSERILQNDASTYAEKLRAKNFELRVETEMENSRYAYQKSRKGLTDKEIEAIETEHQTKLAEITSRGSADLTKIKEDAFKKQLEDAKKYNDSYIADQIAKENRALTELNNKYLSGKIALEDYGKAKARLESKSQIDIINKEVKGLEQQLRNTDDYIEKQKIRDQIDAKLLEKSKAKVKQYDDEKLFTKEKIDTAIKYEQEGASVISSIVDGQFEKKKNEIQHEIDLIEIRKEADISAISNSTLNAQQKAAELLIIEQKSAAQKEKLQRDQRNEDIKKAKFDKETALFQAVINLAADVIKMGVITPTAVATEIAGLAQIAIIAARPIPKYAVGTDYAPGGPAIVGEQGRELIITPSGQMSLSPDKASIVNLEKGSVVKTAEQTAFVMGLINQSLNVPDVKRNDPGTDLQLLQAMREVKNEIRRQKAPNISFKSTGEWQAYIEREVN